MRPYAVVRLRQSDGRWRYQLVDLAAADVVVTSASTFERDEQARAAGIAARNAEWKTRKEGAS